MIPLLTWLSTYAIHSSLLLGTVALLTAFGVRREAWRETLWKAAIVGGLLTTLLQMSLGIRPLVGWEMPETASPAAGSPRAAASDHPFNGAAHPTQPLGPGSPGARALEPGVPETSSLRHSAPSAPPARPAWPAWPAILVGAWIVGAAWQMGRVLRGHLRLRLALRDRSEITDPLTVSMLSQARRKAGVWRLVRLTSTPCTSTPFTLGTAEICLPEGLFDTLSLEERRCAMAHELAHLARRDPHWQLVTAAIESVFFFQPLNRLAARRIRESADYLADDWAVHQTESALGLARSLAAVASWHTGDDHEIPQPVMALAEGRTPLIKRVERLLAERPDPPAPGVGLRLLATGAMLAATV